MMKQTTLKKTMGILLAALMMVSALAACKPSSSTNPSTSPSAGTSPSPSTNPSTSVPPVALDPMDITLYLWGDKPNQMDTILEEFYNRTKDTLNINLDINWSPLDNFGDTITRKLSAKESVDMAFDAPWINMNLFVAQGNYRDLTSYFHNDAYPGLKAAFNEEFMSNNLMGENGDQVFGIPLTQSFGGGACLYIRGDLRKKYGMDPITTYDEYLQYLQNVVDNDPNLIPFVMRNDGTYGALAIINAQMAYKDIDKVEKGIWSVDLAAGVQATMLIEDYKVIDCSITGEPSSSLANMPEPWNVSDLEAQVEMRKWYDLGYLEKDVITRTDSMAAFTSGLAASFAWDVAQYNQVVTALGLSVPEAELEVFDFSPLSQKGVKGMMKGSYQAWNFICIPVTTSDEKTERIMMFFDWLFSSRENHDLFEFGIEGVNWTAVGDDEYSYPEGIDTSTNYTFPGYMLSWNPNFIRYPSGYPDELLRMMKNINDPEIYYDYLLSGLRFNGEPVINQLANPDILEAKTRRDNMNLGIFPDVIAENAAYDKAMENNKALQEDIADIKAELIKQAQEYLDKRKVLDEASGMTYPTVADLENQLK